MTETPAADIVERLRNGPYRIGRASGQLIELIEAATEIEALRAREAELQRKLDEAVKAKDEALALIDEMNERGASRRFYGIDQTLHAKICTIRATLVIGHALASIRGEG